AERGRRHVMAALFDYVLGLADDALILGHRLSEWCGHAPAVEEELALANIALDLIGQARLLYDRAGAVEGRGRDQDQLAYRRDAAHPPTVLRGGQRNGVSATPIPPSRLYPAFAAPFGSAMPGSRDPALAAIAAEAEPQAAYHLRHAEGWLIRLGDGTAESHRRAQDAVDALWMYTGEMFESAARADTLAADRIAIA